MAKEHKEQTTTASPVDIANMSEDDKKALQQALKADAQKNTWPGIRRDFRNIGKEYIYLPQKSKTGGAEMSNDEKKAQLKADIEKFVAERLQ